MKLLTFYISLATCALLSVSSTAAEDIEELVVTTYYKHTKSPLNIPHNISTLSAEQLVIGGSSLISELQTQVANFQFTQTGGFYNLSVRGIDGGGRNIGFSPRIATYIDNIYVGQSGNLVQQLHDIERVELLRGPQGLAFGLNSGAGALQIRTKAVQEEFSAKAGLSAGSRSLYSVYGMVNTRISDQIGARFSANTSEQDGYITNVVSDSLLGASKQTGLRGKIRYDADNAMAVHINADYSNSNTSNIIGEPVNASATDNRELRPYRVAFSDNPENNSEIYGISILAEGEPSKTLKLTSITAFRHTDQLRTNDLDYGIANRNQMGGGVVSYNDTYRQWSQELQLNIQQKSSTLLLGVSLLKEKASTDRRILASTLDLPLQGNISSNTSAIFGNFSYHLSDNIDAVAGGRLTIDRKRLNFSIDARAAGLASLDNFTDTLNSNNFDQSLSLLYYPSEASSVYGTIATGSKSGGWNVDYVNQLQAESGLQFETESSINYEIGYKSFFAERRAYLQVSVFSATFSEFQTFQLNEVAPGTTILQLDNAGEARTYGTEIELKYQLTSSLLTILSLATNNARFTTYTNDNGQDFSGNAMPSAPRRSGALSLQYDAKLDIGILKLYSALSYSDDSFTEASNSPSSALDSRSILDVGITYVPRKSKFSLVARVNNVLDERYATFSGEDFFGDIFVQRSIPRTIELEFSWTH